MANEIPENTDGNTTATDDDGIDFYLRAYSFVANIPTISIGTPITIALKGLLVSGYVTGRRQYLESLRKTFDIASSGLAPEFRQLFDPFAAEVARPQEADNEVPPFDSIHYLHLRDFRFVNPDGRIGKVSGDIIFRCPLAAVDGFFLGLLGD